MLFYKIHPKISIDYNYVKLYNINIRGGIFEIYEMLWKKANYERIKKELQFFY